MQHVLAPLQSCAMHTQVSHFTHMKGRCCSPDANICTNIHKVMKGNNYLSVISKEASDKLLLLVEDSSKSKNAENVVDDS